VSKPGSGLKFREVVARLQERWLRSVERGAWSGEG
jgi:hypothetical protein